MDTPIINLIFQKGPEKIDRFTIGKFHFRLLNVQPILDNYDYRIFLSFHAVSFPQI